MCSTNTPGTKWELTACAYPRGHGWLLPDVTAGVGRWCSKLPGKRSRKVLYVGSWSRLTEGCVTACTFRKRRAPNWPPKQTKTPGFWFLDSTLSCPRLPTRYQSAEKSLHVKAVREVLFLVDRRILSLESRTLLRRAQFTTTTRARTAPRKLNMITRRKSQQVAVVLCNARPHPQQFCFSVRVRRSSALGEAGTSNQRRWTAPIPGLMHFLSATRSPLFGRSTACLGHFPAQTQSKRIP